MRSKSFLLIILFLFLSFASDFVLSETEKKEQSSTKTVLEQKKQDQSQTAKYPSVVNIYRPNYVLPYYHTGRPYYAIYKNETPNNQSVMNDELKAQISLLVPIARHLINNKPLSLNFAYTQLMYWQVYAKSQYFRETNYEPELFIENFFNPYIGGQIGIDHQSNGRGGFLERSWNRGFLQLQFSGAHWLAHIKGWSLIGQADSSDLHNPDIAHFLGYDNVLFSYEYAAVQASVEVQNIESSLKRGFVQVTLSYPLFKSISVYGQFFNGYGQSLIEYNHKTTSAGIGIALNDWMT
jgi:phospholipase A1/A2